MSNTQSSGGFGPGKFTPPKQGPHSGGAAPGGAPAKAAAPSPGPTAGAPSGRSNPSGGSPNGSPAPTGASPKAGSGVGSKLAGLGAPPGTRKSLGGASAGDGKSGGPASKAGGAAADKASGAASKAAGAAGGAGQVAKKPEKTTMKSGAGREVEQRTRQAANEAAKRFVQSYGGVGGIDKVAGALADKTVGLAFKVGAAAAGMWVYLLVALLAGGLVATLSFSGSPLSRFPAPDAPTAEQVDALPPGWANMLYSTQESSRQRTFAVPWTLLAGLAKVESDFARQSPYDTVDRDPKRDPRFGPGPALVGSAGDLATPASTTSGTASSSTSSTASYSADTAQAGTAGEQVSYAASGVAQPSAAGPAPQASSCPVRTPKPVIGGDAKQATGPFLLRPEHAKAMRSAGQDPNDPCQSALYVATQLTQLGADMMTSGQYSDWKDSDEAANQLWTDLVARSNLFADPNDATVDCTIPTSAKLDVAYAIESIVTCEAQKAPSLTVVTDATVTKSGKVTFDTLTGNEATAQLVTEALDVAYAFSHYRTDRCVNTATYAGVFPLSAATATKYGAADRCDPLSNIQAAARALVAGEQTPVTSRSTAAGPYAPLLGGWQNIPWALGHDAKALARKGPLKPWQASDACDAAIRAWMGAAIAAGLPSDDTKVAAWLTAFAGNPRTTSTCQSPTPEAFNQEVTILAEPLAGDALNRPSSQDDPTADTSGSKWAGPALGSLTPTTPPTADPANPSPAQQAAAAAPQYARIAVAMSDAAATVAPPKAEPGRDSLVSRLSPTGASVPTGPRSVTGAVKFTFPTATSALGYATYYGGTRPVDGQMAPRLNESAANGVTGLPGSSEISAVGGDAAAVIAAASKWMGTPYSWGGGGPAGPSRGIGRGANTVGFDCSGLTQYAMAAAGYKIGGTTREQITDGMPVAGGVAKAQPGDLIFWGTPVHHVAIYLGGGKVIHAPKTGDVVKISNLWNVSDISAIRRIVKPGPITVAVTSGAPGAWASALPAGGAQYAGLFEAAGRKYGVEPQLMAGLAWQESGYDNAVVTCSRRSRVGAMGLMQFMPGTASGFGIDACDPVQAVDAGTRYIATLYRQFGSVPLALAAYNAGPGNVKKYGGVPPFAETQQYVVKVTANCRRLGGRCA